MRIVIQRCSRASVSVAGETVGSVGTGMAVLVGVESGDSMDDAVWLAAKTAGLRIFSDAAGVMNLPLGEVDGRVLAVSQFTLTASTRKGNRPSYIRAARGAEASALYDAYCAEVERLTGTEVARGVFGADMQVEILNDGPVTIIIDSRLRE
ncbi:MAG: D-tyrosyl-tRNA(Tyr) deacylase [Muribaculaceae bacterium]|nr:D-tyrosyl-tRNA(Tyr) deacylase [Muribaculaceae bacterium]